MMDTGAIVLKMGYDVLHYVAFHFTRAFMAFLQRDSYLYWPFLLSTAVLVWFVAKTSRGGAAGFFDRRIWWHASARADYRLYFLNALLFPALASVLLFGDARIPVVLNDWLGLHPESTQHPLSEAVLRLLFTLSIFIVYDFGRFLGHCLMHDVRALWEFHKVHHSAEVLTLITSFRVHPVELLIMAWIPSLLTGLTAWLFNLAGAQVSVYTFLGLHIVIWAFNLIDNLRHSPVWLSYGPAVGKWLVSPAHHQLHHSWEAQHMGCNRGSNLAIWDRLYGTLYVPGLKPERFRMGLGDSTEALWHRVGHMYFAPVLNCFRTLREASVRSSGNARGTGSLPSPRVSPTAGESA